jgi:hypothetical protein
MYSREWIVVGPTAIGVLSCGMEPGLIFVLILLIAAANLGALYAIIRLAVLSALAVDRKKR